MLWTAPAPGHRNAVDCLSQAERFNQVRQATTVAFEVAWTWQIRCWRFMALTDRGMLSFAKPYVEDQSRRFLPICRLVWSGWKLPPTRTTGHACLRSLVTTSA